MVYSVCRYSYIYQILPALPLNSGKRKVPRPFGPAFHGTKPNDLLQLDYVELKISDDGSKYALMLRDDHSDYKWVLRLTQRQLQTQRPP